MSDRDRDRTDVPPVTASHPASSSWAGLDPQTAEDWKSLGELGHRMLDDMFDYIEARGSAAQQVSPVPVWQPLPNDVRAAFKTAPLPSDASAPDAVYDEFKTTVMPYVVGNVHPGFMGWVHGGGTVVGMLAEMLSAGLNANCGGRDHSAIEVEKQISRWLAQIFGFPEEDSSGLFVTGTSMANFLAVLIARQQALGPSVRSAGLTGAGSSDSSSSSSSSSSSDNNNDINNNNSAYKLVAYTSDSAHTCILRAMEYAGLGSDALRRIKVDSSDHRMDIGALRFAIDADIKIGLKPFLIVGTAGSVAIGAIDDLNAIADVAISYNLWFHVDGAFGALGILSDEVSPRLSGIQRANSIALDFHKWGQVQYDAGFVLVRDGHAHREAFATAADYLSRTSRGLQRGEVWPNDLGIDLSRGFKALKTWFHLKTYGTKAIGGIIGHTCQVARHLADKVAAEPELELMAPVQLNIVCFRYRHPPKHGSGSGETTSTYYDDKDVDECDIDSVNAEIAMDVQESGIAAPSTVKVRGRLVIRAAIFNHRTDLADVDRMVAAVIQFGRKRIAELQSRRAPQLQVKLGHGDDNNDDDDTPARLPPDPQPSSSIPPGPPDLSQLGAAMVVKTSSCTCGQLKAHCSGLPVRSAICHCFACQQRTGSVFGVQARYLADKVQIEGLATTFRRKGDSGGEIDFYFCPTCGSTIYWKIVAMPAFTILAVGGFQDPTGKWLPTPVFSVYEDRMHSWVRLPDGIEHMN